ncbi:MAG: histidine kinase, partial [Desulfobacteraceae bacterium]|nr:histidine kinase [Desulfobacteraceae bacterium]
MFDENDISLDIEFMDTKRFPEAKNIENFKTNLKYKLDELPKYRLIITGDDNALQFVLNEQKIFNDTPIVFLGVNNIEKALEQNSNPFITGVIESVSLKETIELISKLQPGITGITAISDMTTSGETDLKSFYKFSTDYNNYYFSDISLKNLSWKEFEKKISEIDGKKTALLLLSAYFDKNNDKKTFEQSINLIKNNAKAPVYHLWRHGIGQGILGGKVICHFNQGK